MTRLRVPLVLVVSASMLAAACGSGSGKSVSPPVTTPPKTVVLMTHDSFASSPAVRAEFTRRTGFELKVLKSGDAGDALSKAILVRDHPVADAFFGVDNTLLTRALDANLFVPYAAKGLPSVPPRFRPCFAEQIRRPFFTFWMVHNVISRN